MEVLVRVWRRFSSSLRYRYRYKIRGNFVIHKAPNGTFVYIDNKEYKSTFSLTTYSQGEGGGGVPWVNFCWVCAAGLSEPLPNYSLFCGQL